MILLQRRGNAFFRAALTGVLAVLLAGGSASAATWSGAAFPGDMLIHSAGNWVGNTPPLFNLANSAANDAVFTGAVGLTPIVPDWVAIKDIVLRNVTFDAAAGAFTFNNDGSGNSEFIVNYPSSTARLTQNLSTATQTFNTNYFGVRSGTISATNGDFVFNTPVIPGNGSTTTTTWTGAKDFYFNNGIVGKANLIKRGEGTIYLSESPVDGINNSGGRWDRTLALEAGYVEINHAYSLGEAGTEAAGYIEPSGGAATSALVLTNNITTGEFIWLGGRTTTAPQVINKSGHNVLSGTLQADSGGNLYALQSNGTVSGDLFEVSGTIQTPGFSLGYVSDLNLQGAGNGLVSGAIIEQFGNAWNVVKNGGGTWTLANANTYTGTTTVTGGKLALSGSGSIAATSAINVLAGAEFDASAVGGIALGAGQTLKGSGTVKGAVTLNGANLGPGETLTAGTLTVIGATAVNTGSTLNFDLSNVTTVGGGVNDLLSISGGLTLNTGAIVNVNRLLGTYASGTFRLIDYTGSYTHDYATIGAGVTLNVVGGSSRQTYTLNDATAGQINLVIAGAPLNLTWVGNGTNNNWDVATTSDWNAGNHFEQGDNATFDSTGSTSPAVNLVGSLAPGSVTFTNGTGHNYTLSGSGAIVGVSTPLALNGSGNATFSNSAANTFSGVTVGGTGNLTFSNSGANTLGNLVINGGTLTLSNSAANVISGVALNGGTLAFNQSVDFTLSPAITGGGTLRKDGTNVFTLSGDTSGYTGNINVVNGTLKLGTAAAGTGTGTITVQPGATLDVGGIYTGFAQTVHVSGAGVGGLGALTNSGADIRDNPNHDVSFSSVILDGDTTFGAIGEWNIVGSSGALNGNGHTLTAIGTFIDLGFVDGVGIGETHLGNINVNGGVGLGLWGNTTLGDQPGTVTIRDASSLGFNIMRATPTKPIVVDSTTGTISFYRLPTAGTTVASPITLNGDLSLWMRTIGGGANNGTQAFFTGKISGAGGLITVNGGGAPKFYLTAANDYTGTTSIGAGTVLSVGNGGTAGKLGGTGDVADEGALQFNLNRAYNTTDADILGSRDVVGTGGINYGETGTALPNAVVTISRDYSYTGNTNINRGKVILKSNNGLGAAYNTATIAATGELDLDLAAGLTLSNNFTPIGTGSSGAFSYAGPGAIRNVSGANVIYGNINLPQNGLIVVAGGSLELAGTIANTAAAGDRAIVLGGTAPGTISYAIADGPTGARTVVEKVGTGTWTITGYGYSTGVTNIYEGTLALANYAGLGSAAITLEKSSATFDVTALSAGLFPAGTFAIGGAGYPQILQGTGTVKGHVVLYGIGMLLSTGGPAVVSYPTLPVATLQNVNAPSGPMTIQGDLLLGDGGNTLQFALANSTSSPNNGKITVTGALTKSSSDTNVLIMPNTSLAAGTYTLLSASSGVNNITGFALDPNHNTRYTLGLAATATNLNLTVTGSNASLTWTGANSADWDVKTTPNWSGAVDGTFYQADAVTFGDGPTATAVNLPAAASVRPASITVNSASNYTISGAGRITSGTGITKSGAGTLTISNSGGNDFTGDVVVNGGTFKVGNAASMGSWSIGKTVVNGGTDGTGGTLDLNGIALANENERVEFSGIGFNGAGAIVNNAAANSRLYYATMTGDATVGGTGLFNFGGSGNGDGFETPYFHGNGRALTKVGTGEVDFFNVGDANLGDIYITEGGLWPGGNTTLGSTGTIYVSNNAALGVFYNAPGVVYAKPIVMAASGGNIVAEPLGGPNTTGIAEISGNITLNGPASVAVLNANAQTLILSGVISGGAGNQLTVGTNTYSGTVVLTNTNTYAGPTLVAAGKLELTATGQISTSSSITNNAAFQIDGGTHALGTIGGTGAMYVLGTSNVTAASITQGLLQIGGAAPAAAAASAAVPEPSAWLLLVAGGGLLAAFLRRKAG